MAVIPGLTPGQYYPAGMLNSQGLGFGTPRDWSQGGMQYYDPKYVRPLNTESTGAMRIGGTAVGPLPNVNYYDRNGAYLAPQSQTMQTNRNYTPRPSSGGGVQGGAGVSRLTNLGGGYGVGNVGGLGNFGQSGQISTSITPQGIYAPWMTEYATNQMQADQLAGADPFHAQKQFDRPGVSRSAGTLSAAMPGIAQKRAAARAIGAGVPLSDAIANAGNVLGGQIEREQEALGYGGLYARILAGQLGFDRAQQNQGLTNFGTIGSLLAGIYGG